MDKTDVAILAKLFASSLDGSMLAKTQEHSSRLCSLVQDGLVTDGDTLTDSGRRSITVVLAGGVFDIIHPGHIHTLDSAKALGDVLVVVVATDKTAQKMKKRQPLHGEEQRRRLVDSLSMVDVCLVGDKEDMFKTVHRVKPDVIALGYDQTHQEKYVTDGCRRIGLDVRVARLQSPVPEISSSKIEAEYGEDIHGT